MLEECPLRCLEFRKNLECEHYKPKFRFHMGIPLSELSGEMYCMVCRSIIKVGQTGECKGG